MDSSEVPANVKEKIYDDLIAPAAKQIGSGIGYVGGFVSTLLCRPLHHVDLHMKAYWDKADAEFSSKRAEIPKEQLIEPSLQLVHNAVQSLSATKLVHKSTSLRMRQTCSKRCFTFVPFNPARSNSRRGKTALSVCDIRREPFRREGNARLLRRNPYSRHH